MVGRTALTSQPSLGSQYGETQHRKDHSDLQERLCPWIPRFLAEWAVHFEGGTQYLCVRMHGFPDDLTEQATACLDSWACLRVQREQANDKGCELY